MNLFVLYYSASHVFVTFADIPAPMEGGQVELGHLHHRGMEDMRDFLFPSFLCLVVAMVVNFAVAGFFIFAKRPK